MRLAVTRSERNQSLTMKVETLPMHFEGPRLKELRPRIMVCGIGGAGGNSVNNMIISGLSGVDFIVANTDAQALASSRAGRVIQIGLQLTEGLGAGSKPEIGKAAPEETRDRIIAAARDIIARKGKRGATTREIADVAGLAASFLPPRRNLRRMP